MFQQFKKYGKQNLKNKMKNYTQLLGHVIRENPKP